MSQPLAPEITCLTRKIVNKTTTWRKSASRNKRVVSFFSAVLLILCVGLFHSAKALAFVLGIGVVASLFGELFPFILDLPLLPFLVLCWILLSVTAVLDLFLHFPDLRFKDNHIAIYINCINVPLVSCLIYLYFQF